MLWDFFFTLTYTCRKYILIVDLHLDPVHEKIHILGCWQCCGLLVLQVILPPVLILGASRHHWAGLLCAELTDGSINEVDPVEEVNNMNSHPVILVFSTGQLHSCFQVHAWVERCLCSFVKFKPLGSRFELAFWAESLIFIKDLLECCGHVC